MEISTHNHAAIDRLTTLTAVLEAELQHLPDANTWISDESGQTPKVLAQQLHLQLDRFWDEPSARKISRRELFVGAIELALRDELKLNIEEGELHQIYGRCLPTTDQQARVEFSSLRLRISEDESVEIAGAMIVTAEQGQTLLSLSGQGIEGYPSKQALCEALTLRINHPTECIPLLRALPQSLQDTLQAIETDSDVFLEPFVLGDWQLNHIKGSAFDYAFDELRNKQRTDIEDLFDAGAGNLESLSFTERLDALIKMPGSWGPGAVIAALEDRRSQRLERRQWPDWLKMTSAEELQRYVTDLQEYDQTRLALLSVMGGAASPEHYARTRLRARMANDLGYDLDPEHLTVTTQRRLPLTDEPYEISRSLVQLALFGLHPQDLVPDSAFQTHTQINLYGQPLPSDHDRLTPAYLAGLITELDLRSRFGTMQREAFGTAKTQQLMREVMHKQLLAQAYAAQLQGHIRPADFALIESLDPTTLATKNNAVVVQLVKLNQRDTLSGLLILRTLDAEGNPDGLLMFTPDIARQQKLQRFENERQLLNELVSWSTSPELSRFLIEQITTGRRETLKSQLQSLSEKPNPPENFIQYISFSSYDDGLRALISAHILVKLTEQNLHTPYWYLSASAEQRQQLVALEDALIAARRLYDNKPHTQVTEFDTFVHRFASRKINELLGLPAGTVDPDHITITSPRETLTYTQMLRNGYDNSIGIFNASADTSATFKGPEGIDLSSLTAEKVAHSVHGQWPSDRYMTMVQRQLLAPDSEGYAYRRRHSLLLTQLQMNVDALSSLLKGQIDSEQYQWLCTSIDKMHESDSATRSRYPVYPLQLRVDVLAVAVQVETVLGCHVLTPEGADSAGQALIYTPQAPDGYRFRPLATFSRTLLNQGMGDYYKDRCRFKAGRALAFFLDGLKNGKGLRAALPARPIEDLYHLCFNRPLEYKLQDVKDTTTGRADMLGKLTWNSLELIATALTLPFPPASFAVGMLLALHDGYRALDALSEQDRDTASLYILSAWFNTLGAAGDLHSGIKGLGGLLKDVTASKGQGTGARNITPLQRWKTQKNLHAVEVENEVFWVDPTGASRHVPLYRTHALIPESLQPTGHFAEQDVTGVWQALQQDSPHALPMSRAVANPSYAVSVSLADAVPVGSPHAQGVSLLGGRFYITLQTQVFEVQYDTAIRLWHIVDPGNPFAFFGRQPVRLNEHGQWQLLEAAGLRGGVLPSFRPLEETAASSDTAIGGLSDYEMPETLRPYVFGIVSPSRAESFAEGVFSLHELFDDLFRSGRETYTTLRQNLYRDAAAFFEHPTLISKPELPVLADDVSVDAFFKAVLEKSNGLIIGEAPTSVASKQLLIDNMPLLAEQKVEVLYIEHLQTDQHIHKLQKYRALGKKTRSGSHEIKHHFDNINDGALKNRSDKLDYYHVIKAAHRHGIEVKPFSSSVSYDFTDNEVATALGDTLAQQKMSAFFGNKVISADVEANPGKRWIALLDHRIANTWQQQPGISELQGAISLRVEDVAKDRPLRITRDTGTAGNSAMTRADFKIEMANANISEVAHATSPDLAPPTALDDALHTFFERESMMEWGLDRSRKSITFQRKTTLPAYRGDYGFEWNPEGHWVRSNAGWTNEYPLNAIQLSLIDASYQMPADMRAVFHDLANFRHRGLNPNYFFVENELVRVRETFFELGETLQRDARSVLSLELPARVQLPGVAADTPLGMFLEELYESARGVVVGEVHAAIASKRFILDNMEHLARQDVKTLYMEHLLTDIHQADLDRFAETGLMSKTLLHDLKSLDRHFQTDKTGIYTFENLVIQARHNGIEVRAIDCAASYFIRHLPTTGDTTRQQVLSYFASRTMRKHQQVMGEHKWIALVGNSHSNTFKNSVPGIAELEQAIGVRVMDVAPGKSRGIMIDPGEEIAESVVSETVLLKNDFRVEIELQPIIPAPASVGTRLHSSGMFLVDDADPARPIIIHRSMDRTLKHTPVRFNGEGKVYIERETWPRIHRKPFDDLKSLIDELVAMNMKQVA